MSMNRKRVGYSNCYGAKKNSTSAPNSIGRLPTPAVTPAVIVISSLPEILPFPNVAAGLPVLLQLSMRDTFLQFVLGDRHPHYHHRCPASGVVHQAHRRHIHFREQS
jgi:hypothetical protein